MSLIVKFWGWKTNGAVTSNTRNSELKCSELYRQHIKKVYIVVWFKLLNFNLEK